MSNIRFFTDEAQVEPDALEQVANTASMPFVHAVSVMPDVHLGKGSTVGTVVATKGAIMPACVGVDIGCGMIAVKTSLRDIDVAPYLQKIREGIERRIPLGIGTRGMNGKIQSSAEERIALLEDKAEQAWGDRNHYNQFDKNWRNALGSLGGGNHFIEICREYPMLNFSPVFDWSRYDCFQKNEFPPVWIILHSGSRGVGNKIGTHWTKVAQKQAKKYMYDSWLPDPDLAYLVEHSEEFWQYMKDLHWAQEFARLNREEMMDRVLTELYYQCHVLQSHSNPKTEDPAALARNMLEVERINCHHNFVQREHYEGQNLLITRKGAIEAQKGMKALIPGSMGTPSFIVEGLGNEGSFNSAPHGAGRKTSRTAARKQFTLEQLETQMRGIESRVRPEILDEIPTAYKDIHQVLQEAHTLVRPVHELRQLISVKGD